MRCLAAIAAALSLAVDLVNGGGGSQFEAAGAAAAYVAQQMDYLVTSRPTAVNLSIAATALQAQAAAAAAQAGATAASVTAAVVAACEDMLRDDVAANRAMGQFGADAMLAAAQASGRATSGRLRVLTHCNTGSLATAAYGTALGVIRCLHETGRLEHAYCCETRPYNQVGAACRGGGQAPAGISGIWKGGFEAQPWWRHWPRSASLCAKAQPAAAAWSCTHPHTDPPSMARRAPA